MALPLAACGGDDGAENNDTVLSEGTDTATDTETNTSTSGDTELNLTPNGPNQFMACDQQTGRIIVYDLGKIEPGDDLDDAEIWSYNQGYAAGLKYREDTVFGDVILTAGTPSAIVSYPDKKVIWSTNNSGNNPHSIEILPSGNIVIANSTGGTVRMFYTSVLKNGGTAAQASRYSEVNLAGAHGVLWDPEYEVLWAVGNNEVVAYNVKGEGASQTLSLIGGMGAKFPGGKGGGHDLAADLTDTRYLYVTTNTNVFRFDKEENALDDKFPQYGKLSTTAVKGFGNNLNGNFFYCFPNHGPGTVWANDSKADWCTDTVYFCYMKTENFMYKQAYKSSTAAFYKVRTFYGQYQ